MSGSLSVTIFGTGALAMLFGARLGRAGARVDLVGTWAEGLSAMRRNGIEVDERGTSWRQRVAVSELDSWEPAAEPSTLALVLVKSPQTPAVASQAARAGHTVLSLQNGLGNHEILAGAGGAPVIVGVTSRGAAVLGPGRVLDAGGGATVIPADRPELGRLLTAAGFEIDLVTDMRGAIWEKLAVNCAINPLTAIHRVRNGTIAERPTLRRQATTAALEAAAVGRAEGVSLPRDIGKRAVETARRTAPNRSSMLQDVESGRQTEIEAICGEVVRRGLAAGVATPTLGRLLHAVGRIEAEMAARRRLEGPV